MPAVDALALAKKNNCLVCHSVDKKLVGPAWRDVAAKYRGDAGAEARLVNKVAKGGGGVWGSVPMPANSQVSEADRTTLVRFVLNLQ
ncbi:MAG: c-type cytochrome [Gallionella sp.]